MKLVRGRGGVMSLPLGASLVPVVKQLVMPDQSTSVYIFLIIIFLNIIYQFLFVNVYSRHLQILLFSINVGEIYQEQCR